MVPGEFSSGYFFAVGFSSGEKTGSQFFLQVVVNLVLIQP